MAEDSSSDFEGITWPDYLVIVAYFLFVLAVGLYVRQADMCDVREGCNIRIHLDRPPRVSRKFGRESRRAAYKFFNKPEGNTRPESDKPTSRKQCSRLD